MQKLSGSTALPRQHLRLTSRLEQKTFFEKPKFFGLGFSKLRLGPWNRKSGTCFLKPTLKIEKLFLPETKIPPKIVAPNKMPRTKYQLAQWKRFCSTVSWLFNRPIWDWLKTHWSVGLEALWRRGCIHASYPAALGSNLGTFNFLTLEKSKQVSKNTA